MQIIHQEQSLLPSDNEPHTGIRVCVSYDDPVGCGLAITFCRRTIEDVRANPLELPETDLLKGVGSV